MCKISKKQFIYATNVMKSWCESHYNQHGACDCNFSNGRTGCCKIRNHLPKDLIVPCRWTEEDYELAKLLKGKDAEVVKKTDNEDLENPVKWSFKTRIDGLNGGWISIKDKLPQSKENVLCFYKFEPESPNVIADNVYFGKWSLDERNR